MVKCEQNFPSNGGEILPRRSGKEEMAEQHAELALEVIGASVANKTTVAGAITGAVGWLAQINWVGLMGVLFAAIGLAANIYFQLRRDRREAEESAARIAALKERCEL